MGVLLFSFVKIHTAMLGMTLMTGKMIWPLNSLEYGFEQPQLPPLLSEIVKSCFFLSLFMRHRKTIIAFESFLNLEKKIVGIGIDYWGNNNPLDYLAIEVCEIEFKWAFRELRREHDSFRFALQNYNFTAHLKPCVSVHKEADFFSL